MAGRVKEVGEGTLHQGVFAGFFAARVSLTET